MNRLLNIGFKKVGYWELNDGKLRCTLEKMMHVKNVLYAFICNGTVKYIGKTLQPLKKRMSGYQNPGKTQRTNIKNHQNILEILKQEEAVDIFALPDNGLLHYGSFHLNLAAGLEDALIHQLAPAWNNTGSSTSQKRQKTMESEDVHLQEHQDVVRNTGTLILHKTYYERGFFNLPVDKEQYLGDDNEEIELYCPGVSRAIIGYINRTANRNHTPRIMGGKELRQVFQTQFTMNDTLHLQFLSKNAIKLLHNK